MSGHGRRQATRGLVLLLPLALLVSAEPAAHRIGSEAAVPVHLAEGQERELPLPLLVAHGARLFEAAWTSEDGAGRPNSRGDGLPVSDTERPLRFPRNFNPVSGPDATACFDCHNMPHGISGGGGGFAAGVSVEAQRFDFLEFASEDTVPLRSRLDEWRRPVDLATAGNRRASVGMFGAGYLELLARQMTDELQAQRDALAAGESAELVSKGVSFGVLRRIADGRWDTSRLEGLPPASLATWGHDGRPSLVVAPFSQVGSFQSLRDFTVSALNHHHGIQAVERFGLEDPDGDGVRIELTRADVTALTLFQAVLPVPGRVVPRQAEIEAAVWRGEQLFTDIGCADCHVPRLPLTGERAWFVEPGPYNSKGSLRPEDEDATVIAVDLGDPRLPAPRLPVEDGVTWVPAFTDLKLHDLTDGPDDPHREPLDVHHPRGSEAFFAGNGRFLTARLWGCANQPPYFHHGKLTTLRQAVLAHGGEGAAARAAYRALPPDDRDAVIEFLKSLQVLPPGSRHGVLDETGRPRPWPPAPG